MVDRQHIERILRLNGVSKDTSPDEIRFVLQKAGLTESDIEIFNKDIVQIAVIPENKPVEKVVSNKNINSVLKTDSALKPEHVRALLGIDMYVSNANTQSVSVYKNQSISFLQVLLICVMSLVFGGCAVLGLMWHLEIGMFHIAAMS